MSKNSTLSVGANRLLFTLLAVAGLALTSFAQRPNTFVFTVDAPTAVAGDYNAVAGSFGTARAEFYCNPLQGELMLIEDGTGGTEACDTVVNDLTGKIAVLDRGGCDFSLKCLNAQEKGAIGVIVCNNVEGPAAGMGAGGFGTQVTIPAWMISQSDCAAIRTEIPNGVTGSFTPVYNTYPEENVIWGDEPGQGDFDGGYNGWTPVSYVECDVDTFWQWRPDGSADRGSFDGFNGTNLSGGRIASPTACNGAVVFDSDFYDSEGDGSTGDGPCVAPQGGTLISPVIDLSDANVAGYTVRFYQNVRQFNSEFYLGWSTDGGETWDSTQVNTRFETNDNSVNEIQRIALPSEVNDADSLRLKFVMNPANYYYWTVDDVQIIEREGNNMQVNGNFFAVPQNAITPLSQVEPIGFLADIENVGALAQQNVSLNVTITAGEDNIVFTDDLAYGTIASDSLAESVPFESFYTPEMMGVFTGTYTVSSDSMDFDESNNTQTFQFEVSDTTFAKELGQTGTVFPAFPDQETHSWAMGNHFHVVNGTDANGEQLYIRSVGFGIANAEAEGVAGRTLIVQVYEWEDLNEDQIVDPDERVSLGFNFYEIQGTEADEDLIVLPFPEDGADPIPLQDDTDYVVMLEYSTTDDVDVIFSTGDEIDYAATVFLTQLQGMPRYGALLGVADDLNTEPYSTVGFTGSLYSIVPRVRMHIGSDPTVRTNELLLPENTFVLSPNPAKDVLRVAFDLEQPSQETTVRLFSITGQLLQKQELQRLQNETLEFNVSELAAGSYFLQVETEAGRRTKKFVVAK